MCDLLGMSFSEPVNPNLNVKGFKSKGINNPDGWGIGYYPDESAQIIKEPLQAGVSFLSRFIRVYPGIFSKVFIAHVRKSSVGNVSHKNTHPFSRELNGRQFVFAHNGSLEGFNVLPVGRFVPLGQTDSEHAFCHIMNAIESRQISQWDGFDFLWLNDLLKEVNRFGQFNCIFTDGEYLFCYHDANDFNSYRIVQRATQGGMNFNDEEFEINLHHEGKPTQRGYVIATNPMTGEEWEKFLPGELMVFKNGEMIFSTRLVPQTVGV